MNDDTFPDRDMSDHDKIAWVIETQGWCAVPTAAADDPPTPAQTHTVGFETNFGHPELVIYGLAPAAGRGVLDLVAEQLAAGGQIPVGTFVGLLDGEQRCSVLPLPAELIEGRFPAADAIHGFGKQGPDRFQIEINVFPN